MTINRNKQTNVSHSVIEEEKKKRVRGKQTGKNEAKVSFGEEAVTKYRDDDEEGDDGSFDNLIKVDVGAGNRDDVSFFFFLRCCVHL